MMGLLGRIFGSDRVIQKAADGIYNGVDKAFHTQEEQAEHFLKLLSAYEPFKLAQRLIALSFTAVYLLVWLLCVALYVAALFVDSSLLTGAKALAEWNNTTLGDAVTVICIFYFGGGAVEGVVRKRRAGDG